MAPPKVFLSYSHDSGAHKEWVKSLAADLRNGGVDANLDQWGLALGDDISMFMQKQISESDRVLMVCSEAYVEKAEEGRGGVGYERLIVTREVIEKIDTKKFIPLIRRQDSESVVPSFLGPRLYINFSNDDEYDEKLAELLRDIHGKSETEKPPIRELSFSETSSLPTPSGRPTASSSGLSGPIPSLDSEWFELHSEAATAGLHRLSIEAYMELRFGLYDPVDHPNTLLLSAVENSEIRTFGWPIGAVLKGNEEYCPRSMSDGVTAEIPIQNPSGDRISYDYWSIRQSGEFFLLQSLFEDQRTKNTIFFNTRIVRVTESLMFAAKLYENLGVLRDAKISVRISHYGFEGRHLSASGNRSFATSTEGQSSIEKVISISDIRTSLKDVVHEILAPMFALFEFQEFEDRIYEDIVHRFVTGEVS